MGVLAKRMFEFTDRLREKLGRLSRVFGEDWDLDGAFDTVHELFAGEEHGEGTKREWAYFQMVMEELHTDAVMPPFDAVWRSYGHSHPEPLDWDSVVCDFAEVGKEFPAEVAGLLETATLLGTNEDYSFTRTLERIGFSIERGADLEVKLATRDSVQTFATPTQLLDGVLAAL